MRTREFGDFQTPAGLVGGILKALGPVGRQWVRVLEPTCGQGNFIRGIMESESLPKEIIGIEIQEQYLRQARAIRSPIIKIVRGNILRMDLTREIKWKSEGPLLVIGNPPWVTNSEIGTLNGTNLPKKSNFKGLRGIEAITGKSNFDIAEFIWIKLINEFARENAAIALLCKTSVARSVLRYARQARLPVSRAEIRRIDAKKWFNAAADACLFTLTTGAARPDYSVKVFDSLDDRVPRLQHGFVGGHLVYDVDVYRSVSFVEGASPIEWRQGIKHDAASVLELTMRDGKLWNAAGEQVDIEGEYFFPLIKGSDIKSYRGLKSIKRAVIVTQKESNQDTKHLAETAPRLWAYLTGHADAFRRRKSAIYRNKHPFSMFGIGKYSFAKYKVLVSGLYKEPRFIAVGPANAKPVLCDDTCYLLPCRSPLQAAAIAAVLNHPLAQRFLGSITFSDSKRPITKAALGRLNFAEIARKIAFEDVQPYIDAALSAMQNLPPLERSLPHDLLQMMGAKHSRQMPLFQQ